MKRKRISLHIIPLKKPVSAGVRQENKRPYIVDSKLKSELRSLRCLMVHANPVVMPGNPTEFV